MTTTISHRPILVERVARIMGTRMSLHVSCAAEREAEAAGAIEACLDWLREMDRRLTRFDPASELSRLNATPGEWRGVSEELCDVIERSVAAAVASGGLFDPTLLPALERAGYDRDIDGLPTTPAEGGPTANEPEVDAGGRWREIELDRAGQRAQLPAGVRLDLGGIAKGWAADTALDRFFAGFPDVLINAGGDMRARGRNPDGEPWAVGIGNPRQSKAGAEEHAAVISLAAGGVACSGAGDRWWYQGGQRRHHLIDPRTGAPARLWIDADDDGPGADGIIATATALAPTAAHAEVAAKVALLRGYPAALRAVEAAWQERADVGDTVASQGRDADVALVLVLGSGRVVASTNIERYLATWGEGGDVWLEG
jgi:FAD:protein FMN transferase